MRSNLERTPATKPSCYRCAARRWDGEGYVCDPTYANARRGVEGWSSACNGVKQGNIHNRSTGESAQTILRKMLKK